MDIIQQIAKVRRDLQRKTAQIATLETFSTVVINDSAETTTSTYSSDKIKSLIDGVNAPEGTAVLSTGETGGTKFLREDGDGTCSWQTPSGGTPTVATGAEVDTGTDNTKMVTPKAIEDSSYTKLALGENSTDAYRGDRGKTAYDHSQEAHAPSDADNTATALLNNGAEFNTLESGDRIPIVQLFENEPNAVGYIQYQNLLALLTKDLGL